MASPATEVLKNPFVEIYLDNGSQLNERSVLSIQPLKIAEKPSYIFVYKAFFDGIENKILQSGKKFVSESTKLTTGQHQWMVRSYLVEKRLYNSFQSNINLSETSLYKLKREYDQETDIDKKQIILNKIINLEKLISSLKFQQSNALKEAGSYVYKNFGVL